MDQNSTKGTAYLHMKIHTSRLQTCQNFACKTKESKNFVKSNPKLHFICCIFLSYKRCLVELFGVTIEWCTNPLSFALWLFLYVCFATLHKGAFFHIQWHFSNHFFIKLAWTCSTYKARVMYHDSYK